jgi:hypothetical protein
MTINNIKNAIFIITSLIFLSSCVESSGSSSSTISRNNLLEFKSNESIDSDDQPFKVYFNLNKAVAEKMMDENYQVSLEYTTNRTSLLVDKTSCVLSLNKKESCSVTIDTTKINKPYTSLQLKVYANGVEQTNSMNVEFGNRNLVFLAEDKQELTVKDTNDSYKVDLALYSNNVNIQKEIVTNLVPTGIEIINPSTKQCTFNSKDRVCHIEYKITSENNNIHQINAISNNNVLTFEPVVCAPNSLLATNRKKMFIAPNTQSYFSAYNCQKPQTSLLMTGQYTGSVALVYKSDSQQEQVIDSKDLFIAPYPSSSLLMNSSSFNIDINDKQDFVVNVKGDISYDNIKVVINKKTDSLYKDSNDSEDAKIDIVDFSSPFMKFIDNNHNLVTDIVLAKNMKDPLILKFDARDLKGNNKGIRFDDISILNIEKDILLDSADVLGILGVSTIDSNYVKELKIYSSASYFSKSDISFPLHLKITFNSELPVQNNVLNLTVLDK